jgi:hypothetical protein
VVVVVVVVVMVVYQSWALQLPWHCFLGCCILLWVVVLLLTRCSLSTPISQGAHAPSFMASSLCGGL